MVGLELLCVGQIVLSWHRGRNVREIGHVLTSLVLVLGLVCVNGFALALMDLVVGSIHALICHLLGLVLALLGLLVGLVLVLLLLNLLALALGFGRDLSLALLFDFFALALVVEFILVLALALTLGVAFTLFFALLGRWEVFSAQRVNDR